MANTRTSGEPLAPATEVNGKKATKKTSQRKTTSTQRKTVRTQSQTVRTQSPATTSESDGEGPKKQLAGTKRGGDVIVKLRTGEAAQVEAFAKSIVWKERVFINNEADRDEVFAQMLRDTDLGDYYSFKDLSKEEQEPIVRAFATTYEKQLTRTLNEKRSTLGTQVRDAIKKRLDEGKPWPLRKHEGDEQLLDTKRLRQIVLRKVLQIPSDADVEKEAKEKKISEQEVRDYYVENQQIFDFWWEILVPKTAGNTNWGASKRYHGLLSTFGPPECKPFVSSAHEAMTYIAILNGWYSWVKAWKPEAEVEAINEAIKKGTPEGLEHRINYATRWSLTDGGHSRFGGFSQIGRSYFKRMRNALGA